MYRTTLQPTEPPVRAKIIFKFHYISNAEGKVEAVRERKSGDAKGPGSWELGEELQSIQSTGGVGIG